MKSEKRKNHFMSAVLVKFHNFIRGAELCVCSTKRFLIDSLLACVSFRRRFQRAQNFIELHEGTDRKKEKLSKLGRFADGVKWQCIIELVLQLVLMGAHFSISV